MDTIMAVGGLDPSGCAGLAADLRAIAAHGFHGAAVATALTVQNTRRSDRVEPVAGDLVGAQVEAVVSDLRVAAVKAGLLGSPEAILALATALEGIPDRPFVLDPVLQASTGLTLLRPEARAAMEARLFRLASVVTPNAPEAETLSGLPVGDPDQAIQAARALLARGCRAVLVKGGHLREGQGTDVLVTSQGTSVFRGGPLNARHHRGGGCTLASALAARLARGESLGDAVAGARGFVEAALASGDPVGGGPGPVSARRAAVGRLHVLVSAPEEARAAVAGGAEVVQYREKRDVPTRSLVATARDVVAACGDRARALVNDRADVALAAEAAGVHLGATDLEPLTARRLLGPRALVGATANSVAEAREVLSRSGAVIDYLGVGPVYGTRSKANPAPDLGIQALAAIVAASSVPVIAIGGIRPEQVKEVLAAGAHGVAVLSGVTEAVDPEAATAWYLAALLEARS